MIRVAVASAALIAAASFTPVARADVIIRAVGVVASSSDPATPPEHAIDQSGLTSNYASGVTDFDAYIASNPLHDWRFQYECFSQEDLASDSTSATLTFDLGSVVTINRIALWNEEFAGIAGFDLLMSADGRSYTTVLTGIAPTDNPLDAFYPADVYAFRDHGARFVRIDTYDCPQPNPHGYVACGLGEVAFLMISDRSEPPTGTPAPDCS